MRVLSFKAQFADPVEQGIKTQSYRPDGKRPPPKIDDILSFYTGPFVKTGRRHLGYGVVRFVILVIINQSGIHLGSIPAPAGVPRVPVRSLFWGDPDADTEARADGFVDSAAMLDFLTRLYKIKTHRFEWFGNRLIWATLTGADPIVVTVEGDQCFISGIDLSAVAQKLMFIRSWSLCFSNTLVDALAYLGTFHARMIQIDGRLIVPEVRRIARALNHLRKSQ